MVNITVTKGNKPLPTSKITPEDARVKLTVDNGTDYLELYISNDEKIQYLKPEQLGPRVANLLDCGVAWPDEQTMVIDDMIDMCDYFLSEDLPADEEPVAILPVCNVEIELASHPLGENVLIFPGSYLHSLESYKKREMKKDLMC